MELFDELARFIGAFMHFGAAENFETAAARIVHEEEGDTIIMLEVSNTDVLFVAAQIGEGDSAIIEDMEEAFCTATILHVGPAVFRGGRHVEAVAVFQKCLLVGTEAIAHVGRLLDAFIQVTAAVLYLLLLDERSKCEFCEASAHGSHQSTGL